MQLYSIILDVITVIAAAFIIGAAYKRGFIRTVIIVVGYLAAIFLAITLSGIIAELVYNNFIRDELIAKLGEITANAVNPNDIASVTNEIIGVLPKMFSSSIYAHYGTAEEIAQIFSGAANGAVAEYGTIITDNVLSPIIIGLIQTISCILIFLLAAFLVRLISRIFKVVHAVPVIGFINSLMGAVLGLVQAGIILFIFAVIGRMIISFSSNSWEFFNSEIIESSYIFKFFYTLKF